MAVGEGEQRRPVHIRIEASEPDCKRNTDEAAFIHPDALHGGVGPSIEVQRPKAEVYRRPADVMPGGRLRRVTFDLDAETT